MKIFVLDPVERSRDLLVQRVYDATRRVLSKTIDLSAGSLDSLRSWVNDEEPAAILLGPGCYSDIERSVERVRGFFSKVPIAIVLENEIYASEALELRRFLAARLMPIADVAQIGQFILESLAPDGAGSDRVRCRAVIGVTQLKGGVGTTALALSLAEESAASGMLTALVDLNDVNPQITAFARVPLTKKRVIAEFLASGEIPKNRLREIETELTLARGKVAVFGQPELYRESFHFKADVLENAPSAAEYLHSLLQLLRERFDTVVIDTGSSWGISTFAVLPFCSQVLLVSTGDHLALERTVLNLARLYRESDDPVEFDLKKWSFVVNRSANTGVATAILGMLEEAGLPAGDLSVSFVPDSGVVRWGGENGESFIAGASGEFRRTIIELIATFHGATRTVNRPAPVAEQPIERRTEVFTPSPTAIFQPDDVESVEEIIPRKTSRQLEREVARSSFWNKLQRIVDTLT